MTGSSQQQPQVVPYITDSKQQMSYMPPPHSFLSPMGHVSDTNKGSADNNGAATGNTILPSGNNAGSHPKSPSITVAAPSTTSGISNTNSNSNSNSNNNPNVSTPEPLPPSSSFSASRFFNSSSSTSSSDPIAARLAAHGRRLLSSSSSIPTTSFSATTTPITPTFPPSAIASTTATPSTNTSTLENTSKTHSRGDRSITNLASMTNEEYQSDYGADTYPESTNNSNNDNSSSTRTSNSTSNGYRFDSGSISQRFNHDMITGEEDTTGPCEEDDFGVHISFVFANEKRFSDFHALFRSVPDDEKLIEDYGCALQKEILVQGRLYISENHVCFNANIFGWVTNLVIAFSEITAIEKRMTAFVIPNAISIVTATNTKGHFFASFLSRDTAHDLLMAAWRKSFPCAANACAASNNNGNSMHRQNRSLLGVNDDDDSNDAQSFISSRGNTDSRKNRHRRSFSNASQTWTGDETNGKEDYWGEDDGTSNTGVRRRGSKKGVRKLIKDVIAPGNPDEEQRNGSLSANSTNGKRPRVRSVSELPPRPSMFEGTGDRESAPAVRSSFDDDPLGSSVQRPDLTRTGDNGGTKMKLSSTQPSATSSFQTPTTCRCSKDGRHYSNTYMSETYPGTVRAIWKLLFDSDFNKSFLTSEAMKGADVQDEPWQKSTDDTLTKTTRYTKWLGMPIGPKTAKAILTDVCEHKNFDEYTTTVTTTSTPDVPSGGCFTTKVRTCITWAGPTQVQVVVTGGVEFTKSSWIKGQIEKGAAEGLTAHYTELNKCIRKHIAANPKSFGGSGDGTSLSTKSTNISSSALGPPSKEYGKGKEGGQSPNLRSDGSLRSEQETKGGDSQLKVNGSAAGLSSSSRSSTSVWSTLSKAMEWDQGAVSYLTFILILVVVMLVNIYISFQISNVSSQIERIQNNARHPYHHPPPPPPNYHDSYAMSSAFTKSSPAGSGASRTRRSREAELDAFEAEEMYMRNQEDVMWAWLTEREERHQQYRNTRDGWLNEQVAWRPEPEAQRNPSQQQPQQQQQYRHSELTEMEIKLQTRINDLQEQLLALEKQANLNKAEVRTAD